MRVKAIFIYLGLLTILQCAGSECGQAPFSCSLYVKQITVTLLNYFSLQFSILLKLIPGGPVMNVLVQTFAVIGRQHCPFLPVVLLR